MRMRVGLGPVFAYEWLVTSRRWQVYALRSLFVAFLLAGLWLVWLSNDSEWSRTTVQGQAKIGQSFYAAIVGTQLVLLLLAAPAATAGAICVDKARGALTHLLVTDLSNAEIILGKLAARLIPVLGLTASALPALALGTLLGGVDPMALTGAFLISLGITAFGCSLALFFSVWGTKLHEVLMATYAVLIVWVLTVPVLTFAMMAGLWTFGMPDWLPQLNPFWLAFANSWQTGQVDMPQDLLFLAACLGGSAALVIVAILRVRAVAANPLGRRSWRLHRWVPWTGVRLPLPGWFAPRLDPNPVLWRECHRRRPSRWGRILWGGYAAAAITVTLLTLYCLIGGSRPQGEICTLFNGGQVALGFLLLSITAATTLSEERARGSLDVLLTTPMSTGAIVLGKWWGSFRGTLRLAVLPAIVAVAYSVKKDIWLGAPLIVGLILAFGATLSSLGLALATWIPRQGRVIALTVAIYLLVTIGWMVLALILTEGQTSNTAAGPGLASASPFLSTFLSLLFIFNEGTNQAPNWTDYSIWIAGWIVAYGITALGLLVATLASFNRCLGRMPDPSEAFSLRVTPMPSPRPKPAPLTD